MKEKTAVRSPSEFRAACRKALARARNLDAAGRDRIIADLRLQFEHGGKYVAFIDRYRKLNGTRRLARQVLASSRSVSGVQQAIANATPRQQARIVVRYVDSDDGDAFLPYELAGRD
jgi:hypothetical protein